MHEKAKDLCNAFMARGIGRRDLMRRLAALGVTAGMADMMVNAAATKALAADFDWQAHKGKSLKLLLNKHPYADALIADLPSFSKLTGMNVTYDIFPEDVYFDKVTAALSSRSNEYDAFMTGAYQTWQYGPAGWLVDMNEFLQDKSKVAPMYNWDDILPNLRASDSWSGKPGDALGGPGAKQWAVPWGFEVYMLTYNKPVFDKLKLTPPKNMQELMATAATITQQGGNGMYGVGVRGSRSWATIHPGFLSGYANYGARDFDITDGKLKSAVNSKESKEYTEQFVKMVQQSGPKNWATYTWYEVGADLGAGASGMIFDADCLGYFTDTGNTKMKGQLGFAPIAPNPDMSHPTSNVWIWSLAMSNFSQQKDAGWLFMQWATGTDHLLFGARGHDMVDPVRSSIWKDPEFQDVMNKKVPGYLDTYQVTSPDAKIYFTPQPLFFNVTTNWAAALQRMVANQVPVDEGLDQLAEATNRQMSDAGLG